MSGSLEFFDDGGVASDSLEGDRGVEEAELGDIEVSTPRVLAFLEKVGPRLSFGGATMSYLSDLAKEVRQAKNLEPHSTRSLTSWREGDGSFVESLEAGAFLGEDPSQLVKLEGGGEIAFLDQEISVETR